MKESYKSFDELPMMISVSQVAKVLGISRTRSYELVNEKGFPKIKIGTRIVVPKDEFKLWIKKQIEKGLKLCTQTKFIKPTGRFTICRTKSLMKTFRRTNL